ncbi:MAG TPA: roadblock/LC7 domain-containing protein [Trebonia sp.]
MTTANADLTWLLDDLGARVPGIEAVVMLRRDGDVVGASGGLARAETERLAAIAASFQSLARGATEYFAAGQVVQVLVDLAGKHLLITPAGDHGALTVVASDTAEMGMVAYETTILSRKLGGCVPGPRPSLLP